MTALRGVAAWIKLELATVGEMAALRVGTPIAKGPTRKLLKGRKDRAESKVKTSVRAACVDRDGFCVFATHIAVVGACEGKSEWAHAARKRRSKTRGQAPEVRHTRQDSFMACTKHHRAYDASHIKVLYLTEQGADGPWILE